MSTINDRIGSQNVIRVLSNASAPPTRLNNLSDVNSIRKTEDGLVLVWDVTTEKFVLTDEIDAATLIISGITSFPNLTNSTSPLTGAVKISGGLGVNKNLNIVIIQNIDYLRRSLIQEICEPIRIHFWN